MISNAPRTAPHETKIRVDKLDFFYKDFRALHETWIELVRSRNPTGRTAHRHHFVVDGCLILSPFERKIDVKSRWNCWHGVDSC
jgi:hypothetical protein